MERKNSIVSKIIASQSNRDRQPMPADSRSPHVNSVLSYAILMSRPQHNNISGSQVNHETHCAIAACHTSTLSLTNPDS